MSVSFARDPEEAVKLLYEAWDMHGEEQIGLLRKIIEKYPDTGCAQRAQRDIAQNYSGRGMAEEAIREYKKYIEKYPQEEEAESAQFWIAEQLRLMGKYKDAREEYRKFLWLYPHSSRINHANWQILGIEFDHLNIITPEQAIDRYKQIIEDKQISEKFTNYHADALWKVALIFENNLNNYKEAINYFQMFIKEYPKADNGPEALWRIAECYRRMEDFLSALDGYEKVAKTYPGARFAGDALMRIAFYGERFEEKSEYAEALKAYLKFTELYPSQGWYVKGKGGGVGYGYDREIMRRIANIYQLRSDFDKAVSMYQQLLRYDEEFLQGGFTHFDKRIEYQINHAEVYHQLEFIYTEMKLNNEAAKAHKRAEEIEKDMANIKEVVTAKFVDTENTSKVSVLFDSIDIKNNEAVAYIGIHYGHSLGCGYKVWLKKERQGWIIEKLQRTWVA